jgi:hypothetical protein
VHLRVLIEAFPLTRVIAPGEQAEEHFSTHPWQRDVLTE